MEGISASLWVTFFDEVEVTDPAGSGSLGKAKEYTLLNARIELAQNDSVVKTLE